MIRHRATTRATTSGDLRELRRLALDGCRIVDVARAMDRSPQWVDHWARHEHITLAKWKRAPAAAPVVVMVVPV